MFHIYIKVRRILFEMDGIQSESALPGDPTFSRIHNNYDTPSFKRICRIWNFTKRGLPIQRRWRSRSRICFRLCVICWSGSRSFSDEGGKAIEEVLWFSRTLLLSIFCYLLLHNFSLFVSFIKFFTVNFIHSELPFNCLNRLTVSTPFINHFTSLYIVSNLPFGPYLAQRFNRLKCPFRFNTSVNFVCALDICEWFWPQYLMSSTSWETLKIIASTYSFLHFLEKKCKNINCCWEHSD